MSTKTNSTHLTVIERVLLLAGVPLFSAARTVDLAHLAAVSRESSLEPGAIVYRVGDPPDAMNVIASGRIRFEHQGHESVEIGEGAFGVFGLFDDHPRTWTTRAVEPTRLLLIDRDAFLDVITDHVSISRGVIRVMAERLRRRHEEQRLIGGPDDLEIG